MASKVKGLSLSGTLPRNTLTVSALGKDYIVDVDVMMSNYRCIYGQGCQGTDPLKKTHCKDVPDKSVTGCCNTNVWFTRRDGIDGDPDTPSRITQYVEMLTEEDCENLSEIRRRGWYRDIGEKEACTRTLAGRCIFLNTDMENGKNGCSLWHLAHRIDIDPHLTRPLACHIVPIASFDLGTSPEGNPVVLATLTPSWWGWFDPDSYWCTNDPAAFSGSEPAFRTLASELRDYFGKEAWEEIEPHLEALYEDRKAHFQKSWGQPVQLPMPFVRKQD